MGQSYIAFNLTEESRRVVCERFPPKFEVIKADHITYMFGVEADSQLPPLPKVVAVAYVSDESLEALIVEVDGSVTRPDGRIFHLTLSRAENRKSSDSNLLATDKASWSSLNLLTPLILDVSIGINESS